MAKKDEIFCSFLKHEILITKYSLKFSELPKTIREGINSDIPIIKAIALIVDGLESPVTITDTALRNQITQFLNEAI
jgi:hypothetical protein